MANHRKDVPVDVDIHLYVRDGIYRYKRKTPASLRLIYPRSFITQQFGDITEKAARAKAIEIDRRVDADLYPFPDEKERKPTVKQIRASHQILSVEQVEAIIAASEAYDRKRFKQGGARYADVYLFTYKTGLRLGEILHLEWSDWQNGCLELTTKTFTEVRKVPLRPEVATYLLRLTANRKADDPLFRSEREVEDCPYWDIKRKEDLAKLRVCDFDSATNIITLTTTDEWSPKASEGVVPLCDTANKMLERLHKEYGQMAASTTSTTRSLTR